MYQALKMLFAKPTIRSILHRWGGGRGAEGALEGPAATTPDCRQSAGVCAPLPRPQRCAWPATSTGSQDWVSLLGSWNGGQGSAARLNLNENWNDSSGLRSMGQRVPWPPGYKEISFWGVGVGGTQVLTVPQPHMVPGPQFLR